VSASAVRGEEKRHAIITGAGTGIGRAIALELANSGARLGLVGRRVAPLEECAARARKKLVDVACFSADLSVDADINALTDWIRQEFVHVDVLVHCAGSFATGPMISTPVEVFDHLYRINVRAPYALTQRLLPLLCERAGQIVFINSSVGLRARANAAHYSATKFALRAVADSLRDEVSADGVTVLSVYPGRTATPGQTRVQELEGREFDSEQLMQPDDVAKQVVTALTQDSRLEVIEINMRPRRQPDPDQSSTQ